MASEAAIDAINDADLTWEQRFISPLYIRLLFAPINLGLLVFYLLVVIFAKIMYATPYVLAQWRDPRKHRAMRRARRDKRRKELSDQKKLRHASSLEMGAMGAGAGAGAGAAADDADNVRLATTTTTTAAGSNAAVATSEANEAAKVNANLLSRNVFSGGEFRWLDEELVENDNPAVALSFTSFVVAMCIILTGPRLGVDITDDIGQMFFDAVVWSMLGVIYLGVANVINDRVLLFRVLNRNSLFEANIATALVESGGYIGSAIIIRATLTGDSSEENFWPGFLASVIWFVVGQILLLVSAAILQVCTTKYDDQEETKKGNAGAGVKFAGNLIAMALIIANPITKTDSILAFVLFFVIGTVLQTALRFFLEFAVIPGRRVDIEIKENANWGVALVEAAITVSIATCLGSLLPDFSCVAVPVTG